MKIIAYREDTWFDSDSEKVTDFRMWDHLCRAYGVELQMVREWSEAQTDGRPVYLFDEGGDETLDEHVPDLEGVYVFGRTSLDLLREVGEHTKAIRVVTPSPISMFGICVASMLLGRIKWR